MKLSPHRLPPLLHQNYPSSVPNPAPATLLFPLLLLSSPLNKKQLKS